MAGVNASAVVDNIPPGETLRAGWTKYNAHYHEYDACSLTNRLGSTLTIGDVVALSTADDSSVVADDTVSSRRIFVVAYAATADQAVGEFARSGICSAKSTGVIARGNYVRKSATSKAVEDTGVAHTATALPAGAIGAIGIALAAASGGFVTVKWLGSSVFDDYIRCYDADSADSGPYSNDPAEKTIYTKTITGGDFSTANGFRFTLFGKITNTSGGVQSFTVRVKYGGTTILTTGVASLVTGVTDSGFVVTGDIFADGSAVAQVAFQRVDRGGDVSTVNRGTAAVNSAIDQTFSITFQWVPTLPTVSFTKEFAFMERIVKP